MFSGPTENCGAEFPELMEIVTALEVFTEAGWPNSIVLYIFSDSQIAYIPRSENKMADLLAREGASRVNLFKAWW
ncbi:hypothetical protein V6N13_061945 [Hibiscus sabdariffa]